jgi:hypothetical protein
VAKADNDAIAVLLSAPIESRIGAMMSGNYKILFDALKQQRHYLCVLIAHAGDQGFGAPRHTRVDKQNVDARHPARGQSRRSTEQWLTLEALRTFRL